uniref:Ig-like domain-containing protein n=1 Tax=Periophthalmus magnuspinnatus TaxID=409849 RepID=A0A3B4AEY8_9GOBI
VHRYIMKILRRNPVSLNKQKVLQTPLDIFFEPGSEQKLTLSHEISSYDTILWYQKLNGDTSLKLIGRMYYKVSTVEDAFEGRFTVSGDGEKAAQLHLLQLTPSDSGVYFGAAFFGGGTKLTVLEKGIDITAPKVVVVPPSDNEQPRSSGETKAKTLVCVASDFYPDHVTVSWQVNGQPRNHGVSTDSAPQRKGTSYTISSRLRVDATEWTSPENCFTCIVMFYDGKDYINQHDTVCGIEGKSKDFKMVKYLRITHNAKLSYVVFIVKSVVYGLFVAFLAWRIKVGI